MLQRRDEFVAVACPACDSAGSRPAFEKYELSFVECKECRTTYISPRPTPAVLDEYYASSENYSYWNRYIFPASEDARREKIFRPRAERVAELCERYGVRPGRLLEVGAGFGTFCEEVRRLGLFERIVAVEPTPDLAETCRERGLDVVEAPFERAHVDGQFDVIASFETIEHLFSPRDFVARCASLLTPGGLLLLTCPNGLGFDIVTLRERSDAVDNEHLNLFNPGSLALLVESAGLEVLEVSTPGQLDAELVRKKALAGEVELVPFLHQVLITDWEELGERFQHFLVENGLSSHMWLAARRPCS